jgi:quercetin dioxygenase-like cupin family protein
MAKGTVTTDAVSVDPKHYTVEAENERVRVVRTRYGPGEKSPMHSHPALTAIFVTDGRIRFTYPDGHSDEVEASAGHVMLMEPTTHAPENLASQPFEALLVEQKT